jgi:hypothetical protein
MPFEAHSYVVPLAEEAQRLVAALDAALARTAYYLANPTYAAPGSELATTLAAYQRESEASDIRNIDPQVAGWWRKYHDIRALQKRVEMDALPPDQEGLAVHLFGAPVIRAPGETLVSDEDAERARIAEGWLARYRPRLEAAEATRLAHAIKAHELGREVARLLRRVSELLTLQQEAEPAVRNERTYGVAADPTSAAHVYLGRDRELVRLRGAPPA